MTSSMLVAVVTALVIMAVAVWFDVRCLADLAGTSDRQLRYFQRSTCQCSAARLWLERGDAMTRRFFPALVACLVLAGCGVFGDHVAHDPEPARSSALDTVTAHQVGDELTITAAITEVIAENAAVVQDADLPPQGVLILGVGRADLHVADLITVRGRLAIFRFVDFAPRYGLLKPALYQPFEGKKMLLAGSVKSWA